METLINYTFKEFAQIQDKEIVEEYLALLEHIRPVYVIDNPKHIKSKKEPEKLDVKAVRDLKYGQVTDIRYNFNNGSINAIIDSIKLVVELSESEIYNLSIFTFYGIVNYIKAELTDITNSEINELSDDTFDEYSEAVNAKQRMSKFAELNVLDNLSKGDVLKWDLINDLPYSTVFTKLMMENERNKIQHEISEYQKKNKLKTNV